MMLKITDFDKNPWIPINNSTLYYNNCIPVLYRSDTLAEEVIYSAVKINPQNGFHYQFLDY